jgi:hypothetical protein
LRLLLHAAVALEEFAAEFGEPRPAAARTAEHGGDHGLLESGVEAVEELPGALVRHAHLACRGRDRAGAADTLEELGLARTDTGAGGKDDGEFQASHAMERATLCPSCLPPAPT